MENRYNWARDITFFMLRRANGGLHSTTMRGTRNGGGAIRDGVARIIRIGRGNNRTRTRRTRQYQVDRLDITRGSSGVVVR